MGGTSGGVSRDLLPGALLVDRESVGAVPVLHVTGEVDMVTVAQLDGHLTDAEALAKPSAPVVLDLTRVTFMGSAGLALLVRHRDRCAELGSSLLLVVPKGPVYRLLEVSGLSGVLDNVTTVEEALNR